MTPRSSSFRTRLEMVLMLASVALAMSRYDFRASAFNSRRILTSSSSRVVGSAIESLRPTAAVLEVYDGLGGPSNIVSFHINIPAIRTISPRNSLYMFKFLPRQRTERWLRPGGKAMAISASSPAKSKKMTMASVLKRIETEGIRWIDLQFVDVLGALQHITIPSTSLGLEEFKRGVGKLDGSSYKGYKEIHEYDIVLYPDPSTFSVHDHVGLDRKSTRLNSSH